MRMTATAAANALALALLAAACSGGHGGSATGGSSGSGGRGGAGASGGAAGTGARGGNAGGTGGTGGAGGTVGGSGGAGNAGSGGAGASGGSAGSGGSGGATSGTGGAGGSMTDAAGEAAADSSGGTDAGDAPAVTLPRMLIRHDLRPRDTDPAIDRWPDNHIAIVDGRVASQGKLFLFLPGGNGTPSSIVDMLNEAASHGFHTLGLTFATDELVGDDCPNDPDPGCAGKHRTEVIEGEDLSPHLVVNKANSIENRVSKALAHLHKTWPNEGWGAFIDGSSARWPLVIAGGRSLGGAVSARIAQLRPLYRAEIHSAPGDRLANDDPAPWLREPSKTPPDRIYAFVHTGDPEYQDFVRNLMALGLPGMATSVDNAQPPYGNAHILISSASVGNPHGSTTAGSGSPRTGNSWRYAPVWRYMMGLAP
jgi:hypothetical protein